MYINKSKITQIQVFIAPTVLTIALIRVLMPILLMATLENEIRALLIVTAFSPKPGRRAGLKWMTLPMSAALPATTCGQVAHALSTAITTSTLQAISINAATALF